MICPHCIKEIPRESLFCEFCGSQISNSLSTSNIQNSGDYAGFWIRFASFLFDLSLINILLIIIEDSFLKSVINIDTYTNPLIMLGELTFILLYFISFAILFSSSPGKLLFNLTIVDSRTKKRISKIQSFIRIFSYLISALVLLIGFISIALDDKKQGWHDKFAKTLVLKRKRALLLPIILTIIIIFLAGVVVYVRQENRNEEYQNDFYENTYIGKIYKSQEDFLDKQKPHFQSLLNSAHSIDSDTKIEISSSENEKSAEEIANKQGAGVVFVFTDKSFGSGFIIDPRGIVVTNYHVIDGASKVAISLTSRIKYPVEKVIDYDEEKDIAVLKISGKNLPTVQLGDSFRSKIGEQVVTISNPLGYENSLSRGVVSSTRRIIEGKNYIQIDAPISSGSSGGPIFNKFGLVVAIATWSDVYGEDINFGIPINEIFHLKLKNIVK